MKLFSKRKQEEPQSDTVDFYWARPFSGQVRYMTPSDVGYLAPADVGFQGEHWIDPRGAVWIEKDEDHYIRIRCVESGRYELAAEERPESVPEVPLLPWLTYAVGQGPGRIARTVKAQKWFRTEDGYLQFYGDVEGQNRMVGIFPPGEWSSVITETDA